MRLWGARLKAQQGITLIELLVVVVILGVIAAITIPMVITNQKDAYENTNKQNMQIINEALQRYAIDNGGKYPQTLDELENKVNGKGPWLNEIPKVFNENGGTTDKNDQELTWDYDKDEGKVSIPEDGAGYVNN